MAVQNKYVDANLVAGKLCNPALVYGGQPFIVKWLFAVAAADDDGSVFRVAKVSPDLIPVRFDIICDAITGGSDWDVGLYIPSSPVAGTAVTVGAAILAECFVDTIDLSSALTWDAPKSGLKDITPANSQKRIFEIAGHTESNKLASYDIALTANTIGSGAGNVAGAFTFVQG